MKGRSIRYVTAAVLIALTAMGGRTQVFEAAAANELTVQVSGVDTSAYPTVRFLVTAVDRDGFSPADLTVSNFTAQANERRLPIASAKSIDEGQIGISASLALDTSGSMAGAPIVAAREAANALVATLRPADEVAVVAFADHVTVASPYTQDFKAAQGAISGLAAVGNTALYQAVADSSKWASERTSQRRVVILLSDGADYGGVSSTSRQQSIDAAWTVGVPFYVIGLGSQIDRQYLQDLANATRGRLFIAPTSTQLRQVFSEIGQQVRTQYVVTLDLSRTPIDGDVTAQLTVRNGNKSGSTEFGFTVPVVLPQEVSLPQAEERGISIPSWLVIGLFALAVFAGGATTARKLVSSRAVRQDAAFVPSALFRPTRNDDERDTGSEVLGRLVGPDGTVYDLSRRVVSLGTDSGSTYRLPIGPSPVSLRVWLANEHFMVHDTSPRARLKLNGNSAIWGVLKDGDQLEFGSMKLRFEAVPASIKDL